MAHEAPAIAPRSRRFALVLVALGTHVDLDSLLTYWAVEALTDHWDGYAVPSEWSPNNYYVYRDPERARFVFLAHGADWTVSSGADATALSAPSPTARMAARLYESAEFRQRLRPRTLEVLVRHWDTPTLLARGRPAR